MECFEKIVKSYNYFSGLWIRSSLNKYSLTCRMTSRYVLYLTYTEPCRTLSIVNSDIFRRITSYLDILSHVVKYLETCLTFTYLEPCHFQDPGMFRIRDIFRTLSYFGIFGTLCNARMLTTLPYLELCHI